MIFEQFLQRVFSWEACGGTLTQLDQDILDGLRKEFERLMAQHPELIEYRKTRCN